MGEQKRRAIEEVLSNMPAEELRRIANHIRIRDNIREVGILFSLIGGLALFLGALFVGPMASLGSESEYTFGARAVVFGCWHFALGIWVLWSTSRTACAISLILLFIEIPVAWIVAARSGTIVIPGGIGIVIGVAIAIYLLATLRGLFQPGGTLSRDHVDAMLTLLNRVKEVASYGDPTFIEFGTASLLARSRWKGLRIGSYYVFVNVSGKNILNLNRPSVFFVKQDEVVLENEQRSFGRLWVDIGIGDKRMHVLIDQKSLDRLQHWKVCSANM